MTKEQKKTRLGLVVREEKKMQEIIAQGRPQRTSATEVARGAEAVLYKDTVNGKIVLVKERIKKSYRIPQIDDKLRLERTRMEARLLNEAARAGVSVPNIVAVDEKNMKIIMEYVEGARLKELLNSCDEVERKRLAEQIGVSVARLHSHNLIHGDLTTSNMILSRSKESDGENVFFIDFGLGFFSLRAEDKGIDLAVLHEALRSTHFEHLNTLWENILKSYSAAFPAAAAALKALDDIEKRGRYVRRKV